MIKRLLKYLVAFLILLVIFISFAPQLFHEKIEQITLKEIKAKITSDVSFAHLDISIWRNFPDLTILLDDVIITDKETKKDTLIKGKEVIAVIDALEYLRDSHINIIKLQFNKPVINAWVSEAGQTNFLILKSDTATTADSSSLSVHVRDIEINKAYVSYIDYQNNSMFELDDFSFKGKGEIGPETFDMDARMTIANSSLKLEGKNYFRDKKIGINTLLTVNSKQNKYTLKESEIIMNSLSVAAKGEIELNKDRVRVDLNFSSPKSELKDILSLASFFRKDMAGIETEGQVKLEGFAKGYYVPGTDTIPNLRASLEVSDGSFKVDTIPDAVKNIHLDLAILNTRGLIDSTQIKLDTLYCQLKEHIIQGHAHIHGLKNTEIDASLKGSIHIDEVLRVYPVKGIDANGEITFDVKIEGKYNSFINKYDLPHIDFDIDIANGYFKYDSLAEAISQINFHSKGHTTQGRLEDAEISVSKLSLLMGDDPIKGKLTVKNLVNPSVNGFIKIAAHLEDIKNFYPIESLDMKGALTVDAEFDGAYKPAVGLFPTMNGTVSIKNATVKSSAYPSPIENANLYLQLENKTGSIQDSKLQIQRFTFALEGDQFDMKGSLNDFKNYDYDIMIKGPLDLGKITKIYPIENITVSGRIEADVNLQGSVSDLEKGNYEKTKANGSLTLTKLFIKTAYLPKPIEVKSGSISLTPQAITLKNMDMDCGKSCFQVSGQLKDYFCFFKNDGDLVEANFKLDADTLDLN